MEPCIAVQRRCKDRLTSRRPFQQYVPWSVVARIENAERSAQVEFAAERNARSDVPHSIDGQVHHLAISLQGGNAFGPHRIARARACFAVAICIGRFAAYLGSRKHLVDARAKPAAVLSTRAQACATMPHAFRAGRTAITEFAHVRRAHRCAHDLWTTPGHTEKKH